MPAVSAFRATLFCVAAMVATDVLLARQTENVILITMDGLRWQELFSGADRRLMNKDAGGVKNVDALQQQFHRDQPSARREILMPFFWSTVAKQGIVFGDPDHESTATVTNGLFFSYPGYNELLCGFGDTQIISNDKKPNQNITILEWLNGKPPYAGRVAAFASWDVFPFIINQQRSGVYVNAGWRPLEPFRRTDALAEVNRVMEEMPRYWDNVRYDYFTFRGAIEYLKSEKPRVLYLALGETDDWAHAGRYDLYLDAARRNDNYIRLVWEAVQSMPEYAGKTSLVLTTDHGRGDGREGWKSHSALIPGSDRIWIAVMGPDTSAVGIVKNLSVTQSQVPATIGALMGEDFASSDSRIAKPLNLEH